MCCKIILVGSRRWGMLSPRDGKGRFGKGKGRKVEPDGRFPERAPGVRPAA